MENSALVKPVLIDINTSEGINKLMDNLKLSQDDWDAMNAERKSVLDVYKTPFIDGAIQGLDKPSFTKAEVMQTIQEKMSQQGILLLATETIGHILQEALDTARAMTQESPLEELLKRLMQAGPQGSKSSDDEEPKGE